jgi:MoaA/NifB/PqqE/SkfB family radical SAM enzyme
VWNGNRSVIDWQRRVYQSYGPSWRRTVENLFVRRILLGSIIRRKLAKAGHTVPSLVMVSLNTPDAGCNLICSHCYAAGHESNSMSYELLRKICQEQEALGIYQVILLGGEPLLYKRLWEILAEFPHTTFIAYTNGTLIDDQVIERMRTHLNLSLSISLEGFKANTDFYRGEGVFEQATRGMRLLQQARLPFMVTTTVTRKNFTEVTSDEYLQFLDDHRTVFATFSCYTPVGRDPHPEWQISDQQSEHLDGLVDRIVDHYPIMPSIGRNGTGRVNGCFAARQYFHVLSDGRVEACLFAHWAPAEINLNRNTILEATDSLYFRSVRAVTEIGVAGVTPCRVAASPSMAKTFQKVGAVPTSR